MPGVSIIVCCYNSAARLPATLNQLSLQKVPLNIPWEIILVNNASIDNTPEVALIEQEKFNLLNITFRIVEEPIPGLTFARKKGIEEANYNILIFCDDDNHLDVNYIKEAMAFFDAYHDVGIAGGKSLPVYEVNPPDFFLKSGISLGCRDKGDKMFISSCKGTISEYPGICPIGTGMALRKEVGLLYNEHLLTGDTIITDRKGTILSSGGDNEINLIALKNGWEVAYLPSLIVNHTILAERLSAKYLCRLNKESSKSWILLLRKYNICPWPPIPKWSTPLRKIKAYFKYEAWKSSLNYIQWKGACGKYDGLSDYKVTISNK
jgi:glycosyltransferase involved in cell wall biosynthesis